MILEKDYGTFPFRGEDFKLESSYHSSGGRNSSIPRDSLTKTKYIKIITKADEIAKIKEDTSCGIIWETPKGDFKGIAISLNLNKKKIIIITTYLFGSKTSDKVLKNSGQRILIGKLND